MGLDDYDLSSNFGDEIDVWLGKTLDIDSGWAVDLTASYYCLHDLTKGADDMLDLELKFYKDFALDCGWTVRPSAELDWYWTTYDMACYWSLRPAVRVTKQVGSCLSLWLDAGATYDGGIYDADAGWVLNPEIGLSLGLGRGFTVSPSLKYFDAIDGIGDGRGEKWVFGLNLHKDL